MPPKQPSEPIARKSATTSTSSLKMARPKTTEPRTTAPKATEPRTTDRTGSRTTSTRVASRPMAPTEPLSAKAIDRSRIIYEPKFVKPILHPDVNRRLQPTADLRALIGTAPTLANKATAEMDGRKDQLVLLVAHDKSGAPVPNLVARLLQNGQLRDHTRTDKRGVAILVLPNQHGANGNGHAGHAPASAQGFTVELLQLGRPPVTKAVNIPGGKQHQVIDFLLEPAVPIRVTDTTTGATTAASTAIEPIVDLHYNPLDRLPADFSTELCADIKSFFGPTEDPIFALAEADSDFRQRRVPLIKRMTVPRLGAPQAGKPPRRYLVRTRQEWTFLGYTLGELVESDPLDPGAILNEATRTASRTVTGVTRAVDEMTSQLLESTRSSLSQSTSIDSLLKISASASTTAIAGGFGLLGPISFGIGGAHASVRANTSVRNRVDTSLEVNSALHHAKSVVNTAQRTVQSIQRDVQSVVNTAVRQVSPLLSRVTNLLRWTLYENYMVCTHIEDVVEVVDVPIASLGDPSQPLFTDEQIVDLRRVFSAGLLEPRLRPQFDRLAAAVDARRGGELPITAVHVTVDYAHGPGSSELKVRFGSDETAIPLRSGASRAFGVLRLAAPKDDSQINFVDADLTLNELQLPLPLFNQPFPTSVRVSRIELGFQTASGFIRRVVVTPGDALRATHEDRTASMNSPITIPPPAVFTEHNPLVAHINNNRTYYFGLLCQAALLEPSLRDDMPHFQAFDGDHELWRLPIIGFEGNRALVVKDADQTLPEVKELLADPGAATLIQLAANGTYAEALHGLLKLPVDTEAVHPALLPAPAPVMPPLAVINALTGGTIPVNGSTVPAPAPVGGGTGTGTGVPIPGVP